jgi:branched-chain amino acid transport system substrate-binding protein
LQIHGLTTQLPRQVWIAMPQGSHAPKMDYPPIKMVQFSGDAYAQGIEVVQADHQNRPDVGVTLARQWIDRDGVDVVLDVPSSGVALAVNSVMRERNKVYLNSTAATVELTGGQCSPNTIHWTYDTWMLARSTGAALVRAGGQSWFFITADYAFGHSLESRVSSESVSFR